jgi:enamine deaminase RidA (YjgF/YER057c/UK114 family)
MALGNSGEIQKHQRHRATLERQRQEDAVAASTRFINPATLNKPPTYTQVVEVTGPGRIIYISGQLGADASGALVSDDFRAQAVQVFDNLMDALAAVGATFADVIKVNSYLADIADLPTLREVRAGYFKPGTLPASTTLAVSAFAREGALLEVEAIAALPARAPAAAAKPPAKRPAARSGGSARKTGAKKAVAKKAPSRTKKAKAQRKGR